MASILLGNVKGPQGDTGATGPKGDTGNAATVSAGSVTTVPYGQNARVTNSGDEHDAIFDFVIPQGRPGEQTTDMQNLTLSSMTEPSAQFPVPAIGETGKVIFGKITKWFSDMAALVATKFNAANVVNNQTTTVSGYALDARQANPDVSGSLGEKVEGLRTQEFLTTGTGIAGSQYTTSFGYRNLYRYGAIVCVSVNVTLGAVPAWTTFLQIATQYRPTRDIGRMNFGAYNLSTGAVYPINFNPQDGTIQTDSIAIPSGSVIRFAFTYIL